jgi:hypothetical protein
LNVISLDNPLKLCYLYCVETITNTVKLYSDNSAQNKVHGGSVGRALVKDVPMSVAFGTSFGRCCTISKRVGRQAGRAGRAGTQLAFEGAVKESGNERPAQGCLV